MKSILLAVWAFLAASVSRVPVPLSTSVTISLEAIEAPGKGELVFMLFDDAEAFPREHDRAIRRFELAQFGTSASHTFTDLPPGQYAAVVYQDKNRNGRMDTNFIGFPKEPLVASGMTGMRKLSWSKCSFALSDRPLTLELTLFNQ